MLKTSINVFLPSVNSVEIPLFLDSDNRPEIRAMKNSRGKAFKFYPIHVK